MINPQMHRAIVRPENSSLILGGLHHLASGAAKLVGKELPKHLDPAELGAAAARGAERIDFHAGRAAQSIARHAGLDAHLPKGLFARSEQATLSSKRIRALGDEIDGLRTTDATKAKALEDDLNTLVKTHYNKGETFQGLRDLASDDSFAATLHNVEVPSLTGEAGKMVKNVGTDVAAIYGAGEITEKVRQARASGSGPTNLPSRGKPDMTDSYAKAATLMKEAAELFDAASVKERACKQAQQLLDESAIDAGEFPKYAALFEKQSAEDADTMVAGMLRGHAGSSKSASFGDPVPISDAQAEGGQGRFEALCRSKAGH